MNQKNINKLCLYPRIDRFLIAWKMNCAEINRFNVTRVLFKIPFGWQRIFFQMCHIIIDSILTMHFFRPATPTAFFKKNEFKITNIVSIIWIYLIFLTCLDVLQYLFFTIGI